MVCYAPRIAGHRICTYRSAAAALETAIVLSVFVTLVLGMFDFGLVVLNRNNLEAAACRLARAAIVHGDNSDAAFDPWGPEAFEGIADDGSEPAEVVAPILAVMPKHNVHFHVEWPDGTNSVGRRVRVTLSYNHAPLFAGLFGTSTWNLQAVSVMRIQH